MKNFNLFFATCLLFLIPFASVYSQKGEEIPPKDNTENTSFFMPSFVFLEDCEKHVKHIYLNLEVDEITEQSDRYKNLDYLVLTPKWGVDAGEKVMINKMENGFEVDIFDQQFEGDQIEFSIEAISVKGEKVLEEDLIATARKEDGMVDVSQHLDSKLGDFVDSNKGLNMSHFFCDKAISTIELLAFFRDYLKLSHEDMCEMIKTYNLLKKLETQNQVNYIFLAELCKELDEFLDGNIDPSDENACNCNLIRTNRTALNVGTSSTPSGDADQCNDYDAKLFTNNYEFGSNDDDMIVNGGRMGAAQGILFYMDYDGGEDSPDKFQFKQKLGWSQVTFRSVCVDPVTITPNIENCKSCQKDIELQYGYFTQGYVYGEKAFHINGSKLGMRVEDWALMAVQQDDDATIIDQGGSTYVIDCDAPNNSIEDVLTDAEGVISAVQTVLSGVSVTNVIAATTAIISFVEDNILAQFCEQLYDEGETIMTGTQGFTLEPNGYFKAVLTSGQTLGGKTENNGQGFVNVNSDFYLAAVVQTVAPEGEEIPEYCECEKIGAYVLGSMNKYTPLPEPIRADSPIFTMSEVFERVPFGDFTIRQLAGDYIGSYGPWAPKWNQQGCCSAVDLECQSECAYLSGCDGVSLPAVEEGISVRADDTFDVIHVAPNPNSGLFQLDNTISGVVSIFDLQGQLKYSTKVTPNAEINIDLIPNLYILKFQATDFSNPQILKLIIQ